MLPSQYNPLFFFSTNLMLYGPELSHCIIRCRYDPKELSPILDADQPRKTPRGRTHCHFGPSNLEIKITANCVASQIMWRHPTDITATQL